jgi:HK97 family phage major capsid protein
MSEFIKSQVEVRNNLIAQAREVLDIAQAENRGLSSEENEKIARIEADIDQRDSAIDTARKLADREARAAEAASSYTPATEQPRKSDSDMLRAIAMGEVRGGHEFASEKRTLVPSDNTVPKSFYDQVFSVARLAGPMLDLGEVINTTTGEQLTIPTLTAYSTATIKGAGVQISDSDPVFSSITLGAFRYSFLVPVANELLTDAGFDLSALIAEQAGNAIGFAVNAGLTNGTGTVEPTGIMTTATSAVTGATGVAGAPSYENIVDLVYALDGQARLLPGVGFITSKSGLAALRKIKDGDGRYIWTDGGNAAQNQPATLLGYPVFENPAVSSVAVGAFSLGFGHLPSYKIRTAGGIQVAQSGDFAFDKDVTTFRVQLRVDGKLNHASHVVKFKGGAS